MTRYRALAAAATAVVFLNLLLTLQNIWPTPWVRPTAEISIEVAVIVLFIAIVTEITRAPARWLKGLVFALLLILFIGRYADITAPALFGRPVDLFWDAPHLPHLVGMIVESKPLWQIVGSALAIAALICVLVIAIKQSTGALLTACLSKELRRGLAVVSVAVIGLFGAGLGSAHFATEGWYSLPVTPVYVKQAAFLARATTTGGAKAEPIAESNLRRLGGSDAFLIFLESYGAGVFESARMRSALTAEYASLDVFLKKSDWRAASAFVESPTFGGASWLAHSTTLSGQWITREADYRLFLAKPSETLVDRFRAAGYRSIALFPGIKLDWPEGQSWRFDDILDARALKYSGPSFGWWTIPDQYSLETLHKREMIHPNRQPLFVVFASIMSHMPFGPTPPYQPNWPRITEPTPFDPASLQAALALKPDWSDLTAGYLRTIEYDLQLLKGFLEHRASKDAFIVVSGDHQPPAVISGKDASWSVPMHIFTQDQALLDRFVDAGFKPGLHPARPAIGRMDGFNRTLLKALDTSAGHASR
jgi:hypothetical protein